MIMIHRRKCQFCNSFDQWRFGRQQAMYRLLCSSCHVHQVRIITLFAASATELPRKVFGLPFLPSSNCGVQISIDTSEYKLMLLLTLLIVVVRWVVAAALGSEVYHSDGSSGGAAPCWFLYCCWLIIGRFVMGPWLTLERAMMGVKEWYSWVSKDDSSGQTRGMVLERTTIFVPALLPWLIFVLYSLSISSEIDYVPILGSNSSM